ncbi:rhodanese-like domain-containing protein [Halobacteriovorax sp. ZH4_bin.1]|uniref:rhodanese-like domain-containing protein n=1 Tax=unclassified Halobacteriovorax TaxID=2639665 RepID=UPI003710B3E7
MEELIQFIRHNMIFVFIIAFVMWRVYRFFKARNEVQRILKENNYQLVDVRSEGEFQGFSIPNSINIPIDRLGSDYEKLDKNKAVIVYCASGGRSSMARLHLKRLGFKNVVNAGGVHALSRILN